MNALDKARAVLAAAGLPGPNPDADAFWKDLQAASPRLGLDAARAAGTPRIYEATYGEWSLVHEISNQLQYPGQLARLAWLLPLVGEPRRIVDLGCDDGLYTMALAQRFPAAEVIGLDRHYWAHRFAYATCAHSDISNTRFVLGSALSPAKRVGDAPFDLILATFVWREAAPRPLGDPPCWSLDDVAARALELPDVDKLKRWLSGALAAGGRVAWAERVDDAAAVAWWWAFARACGLVVEPATRGLIELTGPDGAARAPIAMFRLGDDERSLGEALLEHEQLLRGASDDERRAWPARWLRDVHEGRRLVAPAEVHTVLALLGGTMIVDRTLLLDAHGQPTLAETLRAGDGVYELRLLPNLRGAELAATTADDAAALHRALRQAGGVACATGTDRMAAVAVAVHAS